MDIQDEISDFEYSGSEYSDIDEVENTRDAFERLCLKIPESLESKVAKAIPSSEALNNHLFKIRNAPNADDMIIWILEKIVEGGHVESYKLMIPEFFTQAEIFYRRIRKPIAEKGVNELIHSGDWRGNNPSTLKFGTAVTSMFDRALETGTMPILHDVFDRVFDPGYGGTNTMYSPSGWADRRRTIDHFWRDFTKFRNMKACREVFYHPIETLDEPNRLSQELRKAMCEHKLDDVEFRVAEILSLEIQPRSVHQPVLDANGNVKGPVVTLAPDIQRLQAFESPLRQALESRGDEQYQTLPILLPAWLTCIANVYLKFPECTWETNHLVPLSEKPRNILVERLVNSTLDGMISRGNCVQFLDKNLPPSIKLTLLRRIRVLDQEDLDPWLVIKADGKEFKGHKETLRYWSKYFAGLLRPSSTWADQKCVDFGDDIGSDVMEAILNFMHTGRLVEPRSLSGVSRNELIEEILIAADYMQIDDLISEIGSGRDKEESAGLGIKTGPQKCGDITSSPNIEKGLPTRSDTLHNPKKRRLNPETT
ncbi:BTB/POZ domain-containing protein [Aspergillus stella-maris]|uniref:BTB/POZ domain-containing protein n=1 Tax=Aspergillus stella-maris TaxID=1810926 RepID=UPI003CCDA1AA